MTKQGIMVILNVHVNFAAWCCGPDDENGLWSNSVYNTDMWLWCIETLTKRYKSNRNVIGFDIKNELHDYNGILLTYGTSKDNNTDWKVASELAGKFLMTHSIYIVVTSY